jgi:peroxiredoxin
MAALQVDDRAPEFELKAPEGNVMAIADLLAHNEYLVIAFYPAAWSRVCGDEMSVLQEMLGEFQQMGAAVVGISVDNTWTNQAWAEARGIEFPLLSDFEPKGAVARAFGVLHESGVAERALFVVDPERIVRYSYVSPMGEVPSLEGIFDTLEELSEDE